MSDPMFHALLARVRVPPVPEHSEDLPLDVPLGLVQAAALMTLIEGLVLDYDRAPIHRAYLHEKLVRIQHGTRWWDARQALHPGLWMRFYDAVDHLSGNPEATVALREFARTKGIGG